MSPSDDPLSSEQKEVLAEAATRLKTLLRAARVARVNAWTVGIFGALSVLWGLASGGGGVVVGLALLAVAWNEFRGKSRLQALDPEGARILGWNQLVLAGVIDAYCVMAIYLSRASPDPSVQQLEELAGISQDLVADLTTLFYGAVIAGVTLAGALLALYHFRRRAQVESFRDETPAWAVEILRETGSGGE